MRTFEDWTVWVLGAFSAIGMVVTGRVMKVQDEHARKLEEHAKTLAAHGATARYTKESLERIESKLDRVIERNQGA